MAISRAQTQTFVFLLAPVTMVTYTHDLGIAEKFFEPTLIWCVFLVLVLEKSRWYLLVKKSYFRLSKIPTCTKKSNKNYTLMETIIQDLFNDTKIVGVSYHRHGREQIYEGLCAWFLSKRNTWLYRLRLQCFPPSYTAETVTPIWR